MFANPLSEPFREPVSEIHYPEYHRLIATPIDLSSVRESLLIGEYQTPVDLQKDVALMFRNSKQFNTDSKSKILTITAKLEAWFDKRMSRLLHEWRRTKRRLSAGRSSRSKSETRKGYKGKGKGTGKGQSNRIKRKKQRSDDDDDESEESDEESEFSEVEDKKPIRSHSRLPSPTAARPNHRTGVVKEEIIDPSNPQPCSSRTALRSAKPTTASTSSGDIKHETEHLPDQDSVSSPDFGQRRTSNRQHKTPARFLDESLSPAPHSSTSAASHPPPAALKDPLALDDSDQSDDDEPLSSRRITNKVSSLTLKKTTSNEESSGRPLRTRKPKKTDKDFKYLNDDEDSLEEEEVDEENSSGIKY